jgi:hypothetical protein
VEEVEAAVEILDSVRVGSGARITDLAVWSDGGRTNDDVIDTDDEDGDDASNGNDDDDDVEGEGVEGGGSAAGRTCAEESAGGKRKMYQSSTMTATRKGNTRGRRNGRDGDRVELDPKAAERARKLVGQAKEHEKRKQKRRLAKKP